MEHPTIEAIDQELTKLIPKLEKRVWSPRAWEELGANALLDERLELVTAIEAFEASFNIGTD